nr:hypothetical protein BaRGS_010919 [Batillaria attramentaria]
MLRLKPRMGEKAQDEVNFNDSVSNVKSQPERNKDGKTSKDVKFSESKKDGTNTQSAASSVKKIMQQILATLDKEHKQTDNWHLRARAQRPKPDIVYLIYDPADVRLAQNLKADLKKKSLQVVCVCCW